MGKGFFQKCQLLDSEHELLSWLRLIRDRRWSRRQKHELLDFYKSPCVIYSSSLIDLKKVVTGRMKAGFASFDVCSLDEFIETDLKWLQSNDASLIVSSSDRYPEQLKQIEDAPIALFALGNVSLLRDPQVAIVGSRRPTPIGVKLARQISAGLSELGVVITSGMALGIDGLAHEGALDQLNPTIAVMGCGLDVVYPARHKKMHQRIKECGLLISEYPPDMKPSKYTFPERNRIVSGLSMGVLIVEAAMRSGTLITARLAMEQNRDVMVLPGSAVSAQYQGSHRLIASGAALVTCVEDVVFILKDQLERFSNDEAASHTVKASKSTEIPVDIIDEEEGELIALIGAEPVSIESLIMSSRLTPAQVSAMLLSLELEGKVAMSGDGGYINIS